MGEWDGSGDQYKIDTESRYPMFSDVQTDDYSLAMVPKMTPVRKVNTYESQFLTEQQGLPAYFRCKCGTCGTPKTASPIMMRKQTIDERLKKYQEERALMFKKSPVAAKSVEPANATFTITQSDINGAMVLIMFMFLVIVFVCVFYTRAINKLQSQIKSLKQLIKK